MNALRPHHKRLFRIQRGCSPAVRILRLISIAMLVGAARMVIAAAEANGTGAMEGTVLNASTRQTLPNVEISLVGTAQTTLTDRTGYFRLSGLTEGTYRLTATYSGLDVKTMPVTVPASGRVRVDVELSSAVYALQTFVVAADREGQAFAINEQRRSDAAKLVVSSDAFGNLVNGNVGELMKNLPGVNLEYDGQEAGGLRLRGLDPALASITMDGNPLANSANGNIGGTRAFDIRELAIQNLETIEINKAPTPAQPANAMGGSVNFISKNAFARKGQRIRLDLNLSLNSELLELKKTPGGERNPDHKIQPGFSLNYSNAFGERRPIGVAFHINYSPTVRYNKQYSPTYQFGNRNINGTFAQFPAGTAVTGASSGRTTGILWNEIVSPDDRKSASLNLDQKLSDHTAVFLYSSFSHKAVDGAFNHSYRLTAPVQDTDSTFDRMAAPQNNMNQFGELNANVTHRYVEMISLNPGVKHRFADTILTYDGYYSRSFNKQRQENSAQIGYRLANLGFVAENITGRPKDVKVRQTAGVDTSNLDNYGSAYFQTLNGLAINRLMGGKIDLRRSFTLRFPTVLQGGFNFTRDERDLSDPNLRYNLTGPNGVLGDSDDPKLGQFADRNHGNAFPYAVPRPVWLNAYLLKDYLETNPGQFTLDRARAIDTAATNLKKLAEEVWAGYAMATVRTGRLTTLGGIRYERTSVMGVGRVFQSRDGDPGRPDFIADPIERRIYKNRIRERRTRSYDQFFPNLQFKYEPLNDLILRASYTTSIGRPELSNIIPGDSVDDQSLVLNRTNTALEPQESKSYDLSAEYYLPHAGVLSATVYRKSITNYINAVSFIVPPGADNGFDGDYVGYRLNTRDNVGTAKIDGYEISYNQNFRSLPSFWRNFTAFTTYTHLIVKGDLPVTNIVPDTYNFGIGYNGRRFTGSLKYNRRTRTVRSIDGFGAPNYLEDNDRVDFGLTVKLSSRWMTYFDWRNVLQEPDRRTVFGRTNTYFEPAMALNIGVRAEY
jgi:TonB-dependent receptor